MTQDISVSVASMIKVSAKSRPTAVAGAIAGVIRENDSAQMQAIGAGAVNQAVKAIAIASGYLTQDRIGIDCSPSFTEVSIDGQERTALLFTISRRRMLD
ncbi:MAG: stage V sporulation protein S [Chitinophagaceae bacterium]|nr:stage V sporulation protein S [Anaerolineae bacterium]